MTRAALWGASIALLLGGCSSGSERPDFGDQDFSVDGASDRGDNDSFFDEASDGQAPPNTDSSVTMSDGGSGGADASDAATGCEPDPAEPDNEAATATNLGEFVDSKKTTQELTVHSLHAAGDEDWFLLEIDDRFDGSNPEPEVTLTGLGPGDEVEVAGWYTCDDGGGVDCVDGTEDNTFGPGCAATGGGEDGLFMEFKTKCDGTSEDGTLLVRIRSLQHSGSCAPYVARFRVD